MAKCLSYHFCAEPPIYNGRMQWEIRRRLDLYPLYSLWDYTRNREEEITQGIWQTRGNKNNRETRGENGKTREPWGKGNDRTPQGENGKKVIVGKRGTTGNQGVKEALFGYRHQQGALGKQWKIGKHELSFRTILWELSIHRGGGLFSAKFPNYTVVLVDCSQQRFPNYTIVGTHYWWTVLGKGSQIIQLWELSIVVDCSRQRFPSIQLIPICIFIARACDAVSFSNNILYSLCICTHGEVYNILLCTSTIHYVIPWLVRDVELFLAIIYSTVYVFVHVVR